MSTSVKPVIRVDKSKCVNCHRCITVCPAKMCNDGSGNYVGVNTDLCIGCGECIEACSHGARVGLDDADDFFRAVKNGEPVVAVVSPAVAASFNGEYLRLNGWLKSVGVKAVFDVSFGAELAVQSYAEYMRRQDPKLVIAQTCPVLVSFIEIYRPELIPYLAPVDSPVLHTMKWIRQFKPEYASAKIAAITPCYAARLEFDETGTGDFNVTIKSLESYIESHGIDLSSFPETEFETPPAERAVTFSTPGGLTRTAERVMPGISGITRRIEGQPQIFTYLAHLSKAIKSGDAPVFKLVDCLNCEMGCNAGPATSNSTCNRDKVEGYIERRAVKAALKAGKRRKPITSAKMNKSLEKYRKPGLYDRTYVDRSDKFAESFHIPTDAELKNMYRAMRKETKNDMLNCGSCGYKSCEQMAVALANKLNRPENCRHYMTCMIGELHENHQMEISGTVSLVVGSASEKLDRTSECVQHLAEMVSSMASCVSQSSAAIEQMVANISSISSVLDKNAKAVERLAAASQRGRESLDGVVRMISEIKAGSNGLAETNGIIRNISSQTGLLSMNAAIEAAHAGSAGRGFAVVADEIRKLAENSGTQAKKISKVLKNIKNLIDTTAAASGEAQSGFEQVVDLSSGVRDQELIIRNAVSEQAGGGSELLAALHQMNDLMQGVKENTEQLQAISETVIREIKSLAG
ncbi:[Fe-Fe] hydrogenase large subunit C-terminal domain-containing protein [Treponema brennaborense]|uniref:Methyl-accepting chemotaxis sensory transducer n=1 Tax=Treponema brennaborense (strain DSM 12168 / CIP 105900 / DD5/3) TaxID=906968 RepID=F4LME5_TREBD|nr:[Fe-Fe] hydrogenase large subunit C-terminal domain-containing protein [Treponema brennaborense]AEE15707.1 methyl-accepting chemotaxis sensory transducer [Treponema brennaborense DSM 12168]